MADDKNKHRDDPTRRRVLVASGAGVAAAGLGGAYLTTTASAGQVTKGSTKAKAAVEECLTLTGETTEGPYYLDYDKYRRDITEGEEGVPLTLRIKIVDEAACEPLRKVAVDIWHCTAMGIYSSYEAASAGDSGDSTPPTEVPSGGHEEPDSDTTYLRGFQMTDKEGYVTFTSIFPGWYRGRAVHIHTKVHVDGTFADGVYDGGTDCHTGQLYFPESVIEDVALVEPYSTNTTERTTNETDNIYTGDTTADGMLKVKYKDETDVSKGILATITLAVDPDAVNTGQDTTTAPSADASAS